MNAHINRLFQIGFVCVNHHNNDLDEKKRGKNWWLLEKRKRIKHTKKNLYKYILINEKFIFAKRTFSFHRTSNAWLATVVEDVCHMPLRVLKRNNVQHVFTKHKS